MSAKNITDGKKCDIEKVSRELSNKKKKYNSDSRDPINKQTHS
jgi:hypothetical protein